MAKIDTDEEIKIAPEMAGGARAKRGFIPVLRGTLCITAIGIAARFRISAEAGSSLFGRRTTCPRTRNGLIARLSSILFDRADQFQNRR